MSRRRPHRHSDHGRRLLAADGRGHGGEEQRLGHHAGDGHRHRQHRDVAQRLHAGERGQHSQRERGLVRLRRHPLQRQRGLRLLPGAQPRREADPVRDQPLGRGRQRAVRGHRQRRRQRVEPGLDVRGQRAELPLPPPARLRASRRGRGRVPGPGRGHGARGGRRRVRARLHGGPAREAEVQRRRVQHGLPRREQRGEATARLPRVRPGAPRLHARARRQVRQHDLGVDGDGRLYEQAGRHLHPAQLRELAPGGEPRRRVPRRLRPVPRAMWYNVRAENTSTTTTRPARAAPTAACRCTTTARSRRSGR